MCLAWLNILLMCRRSEAAVLRGGESAAMEGLPAACKAAKRKVGAHGCVAGQTVAGSSGHRPGHQVQGHPHACLLTGLCVFSVPLFSVPPSRGAGTRFLRRCATVKASHSPSLLQLA